ncbi:magnesium transporter [Gloeocapsopsis sp. IPPAS B-1203]|uniref:magnesium transporter n=1 Tax=Gloeocapsopsis sp. IPPAS B-1203 TaxID=2049454 RepID=UPI0025A1C038|nr:magnesium transporter [Gloeocapsopsis sp. IPPAS B-1203]
MLHDQDLPTHIEGDTLSISPPLLANQEPPEIARQIAALPSQLQSQTFYLLPRSQAIAVYQLLDSNLQQQLQADFQNQNDNNLVNNLSLEEKKQLFQFLYTPTTNEIEDSEEDSNYFPSNPFSVTRRRIGWLFVLLITNTITAAVIESQEDVLQKVVVLAIFIPLLLASGGNVSIQAATVVVRGLNSDVPTQKRLLPVLGREAIAGILLGAMMGLIVVGEALLLQNNSTVAIVVGVSLFTISIIGTVSGAVLPFLFQFLGFDPALMSAPLSATIVDVLGILIYLYTARFFLQV